MIWLLQSASFIVGPVTIADVAAQVIALITVTLIVRG
jgi:hypothetical protein